MLRQKCQGDPSAASQTRQWETKLGLNHTWSKICDPAYHISVTERQLKLWYVCEPFSQLRLWQNNISKSEFKVADCRNVQRFLPALLCRPQGKVWTRVSRVRVQARWQAQVRIASRFLGTFSNLVCFQIRKQQQLQERHDDPQGGLLPSGNCEPTSVICSVQAVMDELRRIIEDSEVSPWHFAEHLNIWQIFEQLIDLHTRLTVMCTTIFVICSDHGWRWWTLAPARQSWPSGRKPQKNTCPALKTPRRSWRLSSATSTSRSPPARLAVWWFDRIISSYGLATKSLACFLFLMENLARLMWTSPGIQTDSAASTT